MSSIDKSKKTRTTISKIFNHYIPTYGKPQKIQSDHGSQFTANAWKKKLKDENILLVFSSVRHPQSNMVERIMRELGNFFRTLVGDKHKSWANWVEFIQNVLNDTFHSTIGFTPSELHLGRKPSRFWDSWISRPARVELSVEDKLQLALGSLVKNRDKWLNIVNTDLIPVQYNINDYVLLKQYNVSDADASITSKFLSIFVGPFRVSRLILDCTYVLEYEDGSERGTFHGSLLRPYHKKRRRR